MDILEKYQQGAVHGLLILSLDDSWLQALEERGLDTNVDLKTVSDLITEEAAAKHPPQTRRMNLFSTRQQGTTLDLAHDLNSKSRIADWDHFQREAAVLHLFLNITDDEEAKKIANDILKDKPQGDYKALIEKLNQLEAAPSRQAKGSLHSA